MANNVTARSAGAPALYDEDFTKALLGGLTESRVVIQAVGGKPYLRLLRDGNWAFGQQDTEVQEGSHWAINVRTLAWGWVCWTNRPAGQKNEKLGQVMGPMTAARPPRPEPIEGWNFSEAVGFEALCLDGEDQGTEVLYMGNSVGAMRAFTKLRDEIIIQLQKDPRTPCPVVQLGQEDYKHNSYGKIYNPIFNITGWADLGGNLAPPEAVPAQVGAQLGSSHASPAAPTQAAAPARKRKPPIGEPLDAGVQRTVGAEATDPKAAQRAAYAEARAKLEAEMAALEAEGVNEANDPRPVDVAPLQSTQQAHTGAPAAPATGQRRRHRPGV